MNLYVVIVDAPAPLTACAFRIEAISNPYLIYLGSQYPFPITIGDVFSGVEIGFQYPLTTPIHLLTMQFFSQGLAPECDLIQVLAHPDPTYFGEITTFDASTMPLMASGRGIIINPTPDCDECHEIPIANEDRTWGQVKGLYAN